MPTAKRRILVTGALGFLGKNLVTRLSETKDVEVIPFGRDDDRANLAEMITQVDAIVHLAGENRPQDPSAFEDVNVGLTQALCDAVKGSNKAIPIIFTSSTHAETETAYGVSKRIAENHLIKLSQDTGTPVTIFRFPGVFGKWCKPNYNSVVVTFCYNIARGLPLAIHQKDAVIPLAYVDDVMFSILKTLEQPQQGVVWGQVDPIYTTSIGELAEQIQSFKDCRTSLLTAPVGTGLCRALFATYVSYLPTQDFLYSIPQHTDQRGTFVEMLKTSDSGQFSYFTAHPGVTRGGHYHHTKTEKFLVLKGNALFRFRHLITDERIEIRTEGGTPQIVDTIPGWVHDIKNVGDDEMIVMLWANENFDPKAPDTVAYEIT